MSVQIREFLNKLDCDQECITIYTTLVQYGSQSILELARHSGIERNKIYRLLRTLQDKGLVETILDKKCLMLKASGTLQLENLLSQQESKTKQARKLLPLVEEYLGKQNSITQPGTEVLFFRGKEGLQQMTWNLLKSKGPRLSLFYRTRIEAIGQKFHTEWLEEVSRKNIKTRAICSDKFLDSIKNISYWNLKKDPLVTLRYIDTLDFNITHAQDIYNDVVAQYYWHANDIVGIEIHNKAIATVQRQLFELLWEKASNLP